MVAGWVRCAAVWIGLGLMVASMVGCASTRTRPMAGRELVELDELWAKAAAGDLDAGMEYWADNAGLFLPDQQPIQGKSAIREFLESRGGATSHRITWAPCCAGLDDGGSMAYTLGEGTLPIPDAAGVARARPARYVAVWRNDGGRWRCAVQCWTPAPRPG